MMMVAIPTGTSAEATSIFDIVDLPIISVNLSALTVGHLSCLTGGGEQTRRPM